MAQAVAGPARRRDGTSIVFKVSMLHLEADHEAARLRFWDGHPTAQLLDLDDGLSALLLERCDPRTCCERFLKRSRIAFSTHWDNNV